MYGGFFEILYKGKSSYVDFGITIKSREASPPSKIKYKDSVPYMNGSYDFSNLYGEQTYEERTLTYVFNITANTKEDMNKKKIAIENWLLNSGRDFLNDDAFPGYYFYAECESVGFKENRRDGELTVTFKADPFMVSNNNAGDFLWDDINFELPDYIQQTKFQVSGSQTVTLYVTGSKEEVPTVIVDKNIDCLLNGYTARFTPSNSIDYNFVLKPGENVINVSVIDISSPGNIEFQFVKEVL